MKKIKIGLWVIVLGLIALVFYQNWNFLFDNYQVRLNLYFAGPYQTPDLPNIVILLVFTVVGFLAAYIPGLAARFRANKTVKELNKQIRASNEQIGALEREISSLKKPAPPEPEPEPAAAEEDSA